MPILSLSCANCSAPLEIDGDTERFACAYCGSAQILDRKGGTISLKKVESAIHAVQKGTDRTAAELAIPRLTRELEEVRTERLAALASHRERYERARSGRMKLSVVVFIALFIIGAVVIGGGNGHSAINKILNFGWIVTLFTVPIFVFRKVKLPPNEPNKVVAPFDERIARIEQHLKDNRSIIDSPLR